VSHPVRELHRVVTVGTRGTPHTPSFRFIVVGTIDGRIGLTHVHGAERSLLQHIGSGKEIVRGTEFDRRGSRFFVIYINRIIVSGQVRESGTGRWTGGTGLYKHASGIFTISARGPALGVHTVRFVGAITY
jgi:hypothetical protein